ncbi:Uncharacterized membrane protein YjjB, DUF3815 family [Proteiniborus ethanoligenes]|uniref:Uncharacterized membrane protein YjjB, DUF3815 family n=1 Tax=Proteiniborus ethanoligenes TaxID=415015 RepID=A0A1H3QS10_9FIRM|nr:threonine/serine exporter family protein [Proteiniborus ethanoligenes]TAH63243.1 MAG: threonine/serine exporter [Gottschalkiaceae bacterium]SDZ16382.1 Uncharacterized membrane protein YjjB, DUF3815 family [Proteiniborus ethanoligenes]
MFFLKQFIYALLSTVGFAVFFNIPKDAVFISSLSGAIGWTVYLVSKSTFSSPIAGTFLAAVSVGLLGEFMAKRFRKPATIFIIPGIVPLVPGAGMYYTMLAIIEKDFTNAANLGSEAIFIALSIAIGVIIPSSVMRAIVKQK